MKTERYVPAGLPVWRIAKGTGVVTLVVLEQDFVITDEAALEQLRNYGMPGTYPDGEGNSIEVTPLQVKSRYVPDADEK